jgi:hypothetical protein
MKTLQEWEQEMMEEVEGTVFVSCIMENVPYHPDTKRFQVYNEEGTFDQTFDITLDADENISGAVSSSLRTLHEEGFVVPAKEHGY